MYAAAVEFAWKSSLYVLHSFYVGSPLRRALAYTCSFPNTSARKMKLYDVAKPVHALGDITPHT